MIVFTFLCVLLAFTLTSDG
uniref:Uncharacterized protein n=1 Tax=Arundo donax TaxID=35708 RepID=A0A0A9B961_ARUDO